MIQGVYVMPHPPLMVPGIGNADLMKDTIAAVRKIADEIAQIQPDTIMVISPHATVFRDFINISEQPRFDGSFSNYGRSDIRMSFDNNLVLVREIILEAEKEGLPIGTGMKQFGLDGSLDHGCMVPLYFVRDVYPDFKLVVIPVAGLKYEDLYRCGTLFQKAGSNIGCKTVVIASSDLSHRLKHDGPYGFAKEGPMFDAKVKDFVEKNDVEGLMGMNDAFVYKAAMCGLPSIIMGYGSLDGYELDSSVLSYEGPYGVGYMTARILPKGAKHD